MVERFVLREDNGIERGKALRDLRRILREMRFRREWRKHPNSEQYSLRKFPDIRAIVKEDVYPDSAEVEVKVEGEANVDIIGRLYGWRERYGKRNNKKR